MSIKYAEHYKTTTNTHKTINAADFINRLNAKEPTYELTPDDCTEVVNFYADIDDNRVHDADKLQDITDCVKELISDTFGSGIELTILTAHGKDKSSWHIHSNDIRGRKCDWKQYIIQMNKLIKTEFAILDLPPFDECVYSPNRYMRCYGTPKNGTRPFVLLEGLLENTIITLEKPGARIVAQLEKPESEQVQPHSFEGVPISDDVKTNMMRLFIDSGVLDKHACGDYTKWITIAFAIHNTFGDGETGFKFFKEYSQRDIKRKPTEFDLYEKWANLKCTEKKRPLSFGTICHIAKAENPTVYQRIKDQTRPIVSDPDEHLLISGTEVDVAKYIINKWGKTIVWCDKNIYTFQNLLWNEDENNSYLNRIIENACIAIKSCIFNNVAKKNRLDEGSNPDELKDLNKIIDKLNKTQDKLGSTRTRDNIMKQVGRIRTDKYFVKSLNRQEFVLPLKDGKQIDIRTLEITQRCEDSKFTYECGANYIDLSADAEKEIDTYFNEMFIMKDTNTPDIATKQCFIDIIKSCCGGVPLRYIYFLIGEGKNGKSLILNILTDIFKSAADSISKDVILKSKHNSQLTTHLEKLDKIRFGFTSELENTDELNQPIIKQITGGDAIDVRGLQKTNATIIPTANIFAITNELAKFKPDPATQDRLIVIPFYAKFPKNPAFEKRMRSQEMLDAMFSYIMKHGQIQAEFIESDTMLDAKDGYIDENNKSHLTDFIDTMCEVSEDLKVERDAFKTAYDAWLISRGLKADRRDYNNFSRAMKRAGYNITRGHNIPYYNGLNLIPTTTCKVEYNAPNPWA